MTADGIAIFLCSPYGGGVTDRLACYFCDGLEAAGRDFFLVPLREYAISPCIGCGFCNAPPHDCILAGNRDQAELAFKKLLDSRLAVFFSPVYFYSVPAHFKGFIDRAQRFWAAKLDRNYQGDRKPAMAFFAAGREKGKLLFSPSLLTLRFFLKCLDRTLISWRAFRGLENLEALEAKPEIQKALFMAGLNLESLLALHE